MKKLLTLSLLGALAFTGCSTATEEPESTSEMDATEDTAPTGDHGATDEMFEGYEMTDEEMKSW